MEDSDLDKWNEYKFNFRKKYKTKAEERKRMKIFLKNLHKIDEHNEEYAQGLTSFKMGLNDFADLLPEEMNVRKNRLRSSGWLNMTQFGPYYGGSTDSKEWNNFKQKYGKNYKNATEERKRMKIFLKNLHEINEHNKKFSQGLVSFKMGINDFSDLSREEINTMHGRRSVRSSGWLNMTQFGPYSHRSNDSKKWNDFKLKYGKEYGNAAEERKRMNIFLKNMHKIDEHNEEYDQGLTTFKMSLNQFSDLSPEEVNAMHGRQ